LSPDDSTVFTVAWSNSDGRLLAVGTRGGHARVWELFPPQRGVRRLPGNDVQWLEFDKSGLRALVLSSGKQTGLSVYDAQTARPIGVTDEIGNGSLRPQALRLGILRLHGNSIKWRYQMECSEA